MQPEPQRRQLEIAATFDDAWRAFLARDALEIADEMPAWARGRAQFLTFLARIEDASAREHIARAIDRLADIPGVEAFPDWYCHITIKGAGFQVIKRVFDDDVLREHVSRLASQAKTLLAREKAFEVQLGPANGFPEVVFLEAHDGGALRALNELLLNGIDGIARYPIDGEGYLPHVSIARFTSNEGLDQLKETLSELRHEPPGPRFQVRRIELVKAWLSEDVPELDTLATYLLAPARSAGAAP